MQLANARAIVPQLRRLLTTLPRSAVTLVALVELLHVPTMLAQCTWTPGTGIITYTCGTSVGIGTTSPVTTLDIVRTSADGQTIVNVNGGPSTSGYRLVLQDNGTPRFRVAKSGASVIDAADNFSPALAVNQTLSGPGAVFVGGNVGIGTSTPAQKLHVAGQYAEVEFNNPGSSGPSVLLAHSRGSSAAPANVLVGDYAGGVLFSAYMGGAYAPAGRMDSVVTAASASAVDTALVFSPSSMASGTNVEAMRVTAAGNVGIGTANPNPAYKLDVAGTIHATQVIGAAYQDVAEWVSAAGDMEPGTVVVLDPEHENRVTASSHAYDASVAGVVSAQPGIVLGEAAPDKRQIATTGRVKVKVDASSAPIRIGDLLVTSDENGVAMRSEPITINGRAFHQPGTILGKALEPLPSGKGQILVLLSLQ